MKTDGKKVALVTGASGGFGTAIVTELLLHGWRVVAGVRSKETARHLFDLRNAESFLHVIELDVARLGNEGKIEKMLESLERFGRYGLLVNNAGMVGGDSLISQTDRETRDVFDVNFFGPLELMRKSIPVLEKNGGIIANISSIVGSLPLPFMGAYSASKHALNAATIALALENQHREIRFILFEPGPLSSKLCGEGIREASEKGRSGKSQESMRRAAARVGRVHGVSVDEAARKLVAAIGKKRRFSRFGIGAWASTMLLLGKWIPPFILQNLLARYYSVRLEK